MTEESDLCVNEITWECAEVVHLSLFFFFLKGKKKLLFSTSVLYGKAGSDS